MQIQLRYLNFAAISLAKREQLWLTLIVILALGLRLFHLGTESLWIDEGYTWRATFRSFASLWGELTPGDANPPLFYSIEKLFTAFGDGEAILRLPALLAGILAIPLIWLIGRTLGGYSVGLLAALLLAVSDTSVEYGQEARVYSLLLTAALLAIFGLILFLKAYEKSSTDGDEKRPSVNYALAAYCTGCTVALYCHNTAPVLPLIANLVAIVWWSTRTRWSPRFAAQWISANLLVLAAWAWWIPKMLAQANGGTAASIAYIEQPTAFRAFIDVARLYGGSVLPYPGEWLKIIFPLPLLALYGFWRGRQQRPLLAVLAAFAVGQPLICYAIGLVFHPIWADRYLIWPVAPGILLIAFGIASIPDIRWRAGILTLVLCANVYMLGDYYRYVHKTPWKDIVATVGAELEPNDTVVIATHNALPSWTYYAIQQQLPPHSIFTVVVPPYTEADPPLEPADMGATPVPQATFASSLTGLDDFWLVFWYPKNTTWSAEILAELRKNNWDVEFFRQWAYHYVEVYRVRAVVDEKEK